MSTTVSNVIGDRLLEAIRGPQTLATRGDQPPISPTTGRPMPLSGAQTPLGYQTFPTGQVPAWSQLPPVQLYSSDFGPVGNAVTGPESRNRNIRQDVNGQPTGSASGYFQIEDPTWHDFAPRAGVSPDRWGTAMSAPPQVQWEVAKTIPLNRWAPGTVQAVLRQFPWARPDMTLGQIDAVSRRNGGIQQRYIPASQTEEFKDRQPAMLFRPPEGGYQQGPGHMPQPYDVHNIMYSAMQALPLMSLFFRGASIPMLTAYGSFMEGYQNGQLLKQEQAKNQWQNGLKETVARLEQEGIEASDAFSVYGDNQPALAQALTGIAGKYGDNAMLAALHQGGPAAVEKLLQKRDAQYTDLNKTKQAQELRELQIQRAREGLERDRRREVELHEREGRQAAAAKTTEEIKQLDIEIKRHTIEKQAATDAKDAAKAAAADDKLKRAEKAREDARKQLERWGVPESSIPAETEKEDEAEPPDEGRFTDTPPETTAPDQSGAIERPNRAAAATDAPAAAAQAEPEVPPYQTASLAPTAPPTAGQVAPAQPPSPDQPPPAVQEPKREKPVDSLAGELFRGGDPSNLRGVPKEAVAYAQELAAEKRRQSDEALRTLKGKALLDRMREIDSESGNILDSLLAHKRGIPSTANLGGTRLAEYWGHVANLAEKIDPKWAIGQYEALQRTRDAYSASGAEGKTLLRAQRLRHTVEALWDNAGRMAAAGTIIPINRLRYWFGGGVESDPRYTEIAHNLQAFAEDIQAINTGGTPRVSLTTSLLRMTVPGATGEMIRAGMIADLNGAMGTLDTAVTGWRQSFPAEDNPTTFNQPTYSQLWQYWRANPTTGALAKAPPRIGTRDPELGEYLGGDPSDVTNYRK